MRQTNMGKGKGMSNRSLMEFNHDFAGQLGHDPDGFLRELSSYLNSGDEESAARLKALYGVRVFGMRHHSEEYGIKWGYHETRSAGGKVPTT